MTSKSKAQNAKPQKPISKTEQFIALLGNKAGCDVASLSKELGWLPHTVRAGLTRLQQKGYTLEKKKTGTQARLHYRITAKPKAAHHAG